MNRERIGAAVLRAYPAEMRDARGAEMLGTLLDASAGSSLRFARETAGLLRLGLRSRATRIAAGGARRLIADGACVAGAFFLTQDLATALHSRGVLLAGAFSGPFAALALVAATVFAIIAVGLLTTDPRPAIAVALVPPAGQSRRIEHVRGR